MDEIAVISHQERPVASLTLEAGPYKDVHAELRNHVGDAVRESIVDGVRSFTSDELRIICGPSPDGESGAEHVSPEVDRNADR
jgi:hypothetical protein